MTSILNSLRRVASAYWRPDADDAAILSTTRPCEESNWTFEMEGNVMLVVYTCPECGEKTPQNLAIPEGNPGWN